MCDRMEIPTKYIDGSESNVKMLMEEKAMLRSTLEEVEIDFEEYQKQTAQVIEDYEGQLSDLKEQLGFQTAKVTEFQYLHQVVESENTELQRQLQQVSQQLQDSKSQIQKYEKMQLDNIYQSQYEQTKVKLDNSDMRSNFAWLATAYETRGRDIEALKLELEQIKSSIQLRQEQIVLKSDMAKSQFKNSQDQQLTASSLNLSQASVTKQLFLQNQETFCQNLDINELKLCLYRAIIMCTALGAPFDVFDEKVIQNILHDSKIISGESNSLTIQRIKQETKQLSDQQTLKIIQDYLAKGLFKLGMRNKLHQQDKMWKQDLYEGQDGSFQLDFVTSDQLKQIVEQLSSDYQLVDEDNKRLAETVSQLQNRLQSQLMQNEKLQAMMQGKDSIYKQVSEVCSFQNQYSSQLFGQINTYIGKIMSEFQDQKQELAAEANVRIAAACGQMEQNQLKVEQLVSLLDQQQAQLNEVGGILSSDQANTIAEKLKQIHQNLQCLNQNKPSIIDVSMLLKQNYNVPVPASILSHLDKINEQVSVAITQQHDNDVIKSYLILYLILKQPNVVSFLDQKSGKQSLEADDLFIERQLSQFCVNLQKQNVNFSKLLEQASLKCDGNMVQKLVTDQQKMQQKIAEQNDIIDGLNKQIDTFCSNLLVEVRFSGPNVEFSRIEGVEDVQELIKKCQVQSKSGRYLSFLESLVAELITFYAANQVPLFQATKAMQDLVREQQQNFNNQNNTYLQFTKEFSSAVDVVQSLVKQVHYLNQFCDDQNIFAEASGEIRSLLSDQSKQYQSVINSLNRVTAAYQTTFDTFVPDELSGQYNSEQILTIQQNVSHELLQLQEQMMKLKEEVYDDKSRVQVYLSTQTQHNVEKVKKCQLIIKQLEERIRLLSKECISTRRHYIRATAQTDQAKLKLLQETAQAKQELQNAKVHHSRELRIQADDLKKAFLNIRVSLEDQIHTLLKQKDVTTVGVFK